MKVSLIKERSIQGYMESNSGSRKSFLNFIQKIKEVDWESIDDIKNTFNSAKIICEGTRIIFKIAGNNYRMICGFEKRKTSIFLFVKFIGTHSEYDKINKTSRQCEVDNFKSSKQNQATAINRGLAKKSQSQSNRNNQADERIISSKKR